MTGRSIPKDAYRSMTGLQLIEAMVSGAMPVASIGALMKMRARGCGDGWVEFAGTPGREHYNPGGTVHGGYAATLLDSAMALAVHTKLPAGQGSTTVDLNITYLKAMTERTGEVIARGDVISAGRRIATARGELRDSEGRLLATGTTTCLIFPIDGDPA